MELPYFISLCLAHSGDSPSRIAGLSWGDIHTKRGSRMQARLTSSTLSSSSTSSRSVLLGGVGMALMVTLSVAAMPAQARPGDHRAHHVRAAHHGHRHWASSQRRERTANTDGEHSTSASGGGSDLVSEARAALGSGD